MRRRPFSRKHYRSGKPRTAEGARRLLRLLGSAESADGRSRRREIGPGVGTPTIDDAGAERYATYTLVQLADVEWALGELDAAVARMRETTELLRKTPFTKVMLGICLTNLAGVHIERGELDDAFVAASEGLPLLKEAGFAWTPPRSSRAPRGARREPCERRPHRRPLRLGVLVPKDTAPAQRSALA